MGVSLSCMDPRGMGVVLKAPGLLEVSPSQPKLLKASRTNPKSAVCDLVRVWEGA